MKLTVEITKKDARRKDLVQALRHLIEQLEGTDNWVGLVKDDFEYTGNWEAR